MSKTAVSFAFNSPERLSAETAARIREIAEALGYRPDPVARLLTQRRTMTLGVLTPQALAVVFGNPYFAAVRGRGGRGGRAARLRAALHLAAAGFACQRGRAAAVDGVVAIGLSADHPEVSEIRRARPAARPRRCAGAARARLGRRRRRGRRRAAARHLLELGHRDVLVLAVERPVRPRPARGQRHRAAAPRLSRGIRGGGVRSRRRARGGRACLFDGGAQAFRRAWSRGLRPTAVLAMSDALAIGAMRAPRDLGRASRATLSVVGFDDIDLAGDVDPPLTTVRQPIARKGRRGGPPAARRDRRPDGDAGRAEHLRPGHPPGRPRLDRARPRRLTGTPAGTRPGRTCDDAGHARHARLGPRRGLLPDLPRPIRRQRARPEARAPRAWDAPPTNHGFKGGDLLGVAEHLDHLA